MKTDKKVIGCLGVSLTIVVVIAGIFISFFVFFLDVLGGFNPDREEIASIMFVDNRYYSCNGFIISYSLSNLFQK